MSNEPLQITKITPIMAEKGTGQTHKFTLSDGSGDYLPKQLSRCVGIPWETLKKRMAAYGVYCYLVFYRGRIPKALSQKHRIAKIVEPVSRVLNKVAADVEKDGSILTRSGRSITANSPLDDELYKLPPAAEGRWIREQNTKNRFDDQADQLEPTYISREKLAEFNKQMQRKGFQRPCDFTNNAVLSL